MEHSHSEQAHMTEFDQTVNGDDQAVAGVVAEAVSSGQANGLQMIHCEESTNLGGQ